MSGFLKNIAKWGKAQLMAPFGDLLLPATIAAGGAGLAGLGSLFAGGGAAAGGVGASTFGDVGGAAGGLTTGAGVGAGGGGVGGLGALSFGDVGGAAGGLIPGTGAAGTAAGTSGAIPGAASILSSLGNVGAATGGGAATTAPGGGTGILSGLTNFLKANPLLTSGGLSLGSNLIGSLSQSSMLEDLNEANQQAQQEFLNTINPPQSVLENRFADRSRQIRTSASQGRRQVANTLAARGVRGRGVASPIANFENRIVQPALNQARNQIFGQFNVPSSAGPANFAPSAGQLFSSNIGQVGSFLSPLLLSKLLTK